MAELKDKVHALAENIHDRVVEFRRHLHANPELSFQEVETAKYIKERLAEIGIGPIQEMADNGLVALIEGQEPESGFVALRADIDALPILEANDVPYRSRNEGVMHACGHDVHTSSLLGSAMILNELKEEFRGTVKLVFQPAEERFPGGAKLMIRDGALENPKPEYMLGQHVYPDLPVGKVGFHGGKYMASCDEIVMTVHGKGGHAAMPHQLIDPILITSHLIVAIQQLVSRAANPFLPTVISFGRVIADGATNVIPNSVFVEGTIRTMDETWRSELHRKLDQLVTFMSESMGGRVDLEIKKGYPYLVNNESLTGRMRDHATKYLGEERVVEVPMRMGSEDFAYYSQQIPSCFYRLGIANPDAGITSGLHTPTFNIDEDALRIGSGLMSYLALKELGN